MANGDNAFEQQIIEEIFSFASAIYRVTELFPNDENLKNRLREFSVEFFTRATQFHRQIELKNDSAVLIAVLSALTGLESCILFSGKLGIMKAVNAAVLRQECFGFREYFEGKLQRYQRSFLTNGAEEVSSPLEQRQKHQKQQKVSFGGDLINDILVSDKNKNDISKDVNSVVNIYASRKNGKDSGLTLDRKDKIVQYLKEKKEARMVDIASLFREQFSLKTLQRDLSQLIENGKVARRGDKRWAIYYLSTQGSPYEVPSVFLGGSN